MASPSQYILSRGLHSRIRLNFQHWTIKRICDGLIHPRIPLRSRASVADLGTGTAIWPIEVAEQMKATDIKGTIDGFDVSSEQYPPTNLLPANVNLHVQDAFGTFPSKYISHFDLVNIRGFVSFTRLPAAEKLLRNVSQILKPGGYLQWIDLDPHETRVVRPRTDVSASPTLEELLKVIRRPVKDEDPVFTFLPNLPGLALEHRLQNVQKDSISTSDLDQQFLNQSVVMAFEESVMRSAKSKGPNAVAEAEVLLEKLLAEIEAGSHIHMELFCFIAQKL
ncbi:hypothetical protein NX059_000828 [Plenodomus lindquistii]|nr:hypothetical protein NX059_000828 [Plenodomus lindquistii]